MHYYESPPMPLRCVFSTQYKGLTHLLLVQTAFPQQQISQDLKVFKSCTFGSIIPNVQEIEILDQLLK